MNQKQQKTDNDIKALERDATRALKRGMIAGGLLAADVIAIIGYAFARNGEFTNDRAFPAMLVALLGLYATSATGFCRYAGIQGKIISNKNQR